MRFERFSFGSIRIDVVTYDHDVVIDRGTPRIVASLRVHVARRGSGRGLLRVEISRKGAALSVAIMQAEALVAGVDSAGAHLFAVSHPGVLLPMETMGYGAVGSGGLHKAKLVNSRCAGQGAHRKGITPRSETR